VHAFRIWAPHAKGVELLLDGRPLTMTQSDRGWWERPVADARPGARYLLSLDGGPGRPDPRSPYQPLGVDGPSQLVDHARFAWTDRGWKGFLLPGSVLYELHVGTFSAAGTFEGAIEKLPHLVALGVDAIELMPVGEFSGSRGWGYDGVDLFAPHSAYGGPEGLKRLVDACHGAGLGVVMDVVYNHLGPAGNYLPEFGPYFSERHVTNWGPAVNFDGPHSDEVRRFVIDNALMWLRDYHCDGLRLDAVHAILDDSAVHILEQLESEVQALSAHLGRPLWLMPETDLNDPKFVRSPDVGGFGLDASWADEWHHALHACLTGERDGYYEDFGRMAQLAKALKQAWVYDGVWSPHRRRTHGRHPGQLPGNRFVVSTQNHDQVGNRALGERSAALMSSGRLRIAAALLLTSPFIPLLFMGEEWGASTPFQYFTDHPDPELGRAVSEGRRREFAHFGWDPQRVPDPQDPATFERSRLDWSEPGGGVHLELLSWYSELIALRRRLPALTDPRREGIEVGYDEREGWLLFRRGDIEVGANLGSDPVDLEVGATELLLGSDPGVRLDETRLVLPPDSVAVLTTGS
jgi:maltooligosyltrehalose trehalohydrolase